jgi:transcriptional regulator with XRE-family HTH domain
MASALEAGKRLSWAEYIRHIGGTRKNIAAATGVSESLVSRWLSGDVHPSAENVVAFARAFHVPPVEALMVTDYLNPDEVEGAFEVRFSPKALSNEEFVAELADRLSRSEVDDITERLSAPDNPGECGQHGLGLG